MSFFQFRLELLYVFYNWTLISLFYYDFHTSFLDLTSISFHLHVSETAVDFSAISLHPKFANNKLVNCQWFMSKWTHISIRTF